MGGDVGADEESRVDTSEVATDSATNASAHRALVVFVAVEIAGFLTYLVIGRFMWFYGDEWGVIAGRGLHDSFRAHGGHLIALPYATLRTMYLVFGLRSYLPYLATIVALHLVVAALLRTIMRRAGVGPWVATAAASLYVFFGAGSQNILWAFQLTLVGAAAFGLAQLIFADHAGPVSRRDWIGLGFGLLAILCSGVAVTMVAVVGVSALIRGRWRAALFHTVPLGVIWAFWSWRSGGASAQATSPRVLFVWDRAALGAAFRSLGHVAPVGWALGATLVVGLVLVFRRPQSDTSRARIALPLAMLTGAFLFLTITGASRAGLGGRGPESSRYLDVDAVLLLPPIAVAADALVRRHRAFLALVLALFLVGIPGNIAAASGNFPSAKYFRAYRQMMLSLPRMSLATRVPGSLHPDPNQAPTVTISWLLDQARSGRLPKTRLPTAIETATNTLRLSLDQSVGSAGSNCREIHGPVSFRLRPGEAFSVRGTVGIQLVQEHAVSVRLPYGAGLFTGSREHKLTDVGGDLALRIARVPGSRTPALCGLPKPRS